MQPQPVPGLLQRIFDHLGCLKESLHATCEEERFSARPNIGDVLEAKQETPPDVDITVGSIVVMPVLVQPEQFMNIASVHGSAAIRL